MRERPPINRTPPKRDKQPFPRGSQEEIDSKKNAAMQHARSGYSGKEFRDCPKDHVYLIFLIVCLRRKIDVENDAREFFDFMEKHHDEFIPKFNTRWLVSVCDTYGENGLTPLERSNGMLISSVVNHIKLMDTYVDMVKDPEFKPEYVPGGGIKYQPKHKWDGIRTFATHYGDMVENLYLRLDGAISETPILYKIWKEILNRIEEHDNSMSRLMNFHGRKFKRVRMKHARLDK